MNLQVFKNSHLWIPILGSVMLVGWEFPWWFTAMNFAFLLWRFLIEKQVLPLPPRWLSNGLALLVFALVYTKYGSLLNREASPLFFLSLCTLKVLEYRTQRDHVLVVLLLIFLLSTKFLFAIDIWLVPILLWLLYHLWLSLIPRRSQNTPVGWPLKWLLIKIGLAALPMSLLLYFLFPRLNSYMIRSPLPNQTAITGFGSEIAPGSISQLIKSQELVFRVEVLGGTSLENKQLYWRGLVLKKSEGFRWTQGPRTEDLMPAEAPASTVTYKMTLEPTQQRWTFPLEFPLNLSGSAVPLIRSRDGLYMTSTAINSRTVFQGESQPQALAKPKSLEPYLQLPPISPEVQNLVNKLKGKNLSRQQIVQKVLDYFSNNGFNYTLEPGPMDSREVDDFLFRSKKGFCEHFAASFGILARAAGVPARVVIGYQGGVYNKLGNFYTVTSQDAHAWNEFVNDRGEWQRVDVVDVVAPLRTELGAAEFLDVPEDLRSFNLKSPRTLSLWTASYEFAEMYFSSLNFYWTQWLLDFSLEKQLDLLQVLPIPVVILLFLFAAATFFLFLTHRLWAFWSDKKNLMNLIYQALLKWAASHGLPKAPWEGPMSFLDRASTVWPAHQTDLRRIIHGYVDFTYGDKTPHFDDIFAFVRSLRRIERATARHKSFGA